MAWNKRGNTSGGASSGSGGTKRGGSARTPVSSGTGGGLLTCPQCLGEKQIGNPALEADEEGTYRGEDLTRCPRCGGAGEVKPQ